MTPRPLLRCLWPILRRGGGEVQLGIDPTRSVVVHGLSEPQIAALESLDGTRVLPPVLAEDTALLTLLRGHGLVAEVEDHPDVPVELRAGLAGEAEAVMRTTGPGQGYAALARRRAACVLVAGRGPLPFAIATLLRRASVGRVLVGNDALDDALAGDAAGRATERAAPLPSVVVLVAAQAVGPGLAEPWRRRGIPVLPVVMHLVEAMVGPLVGPDGPCLRCLDLTRADLDSAWPMLAGQLARPAVGRGPEVGGQTALVAVAAGLACMVALAVLDGQALPVGRSLEVALPWPGVRQRQWQVHPRCSCHLSGHTEASGQPAASADRPQATMVP